MVVSYGLQQLGRARNGVHSLLLTSEGRHPPQGMGGEEGWGGAGERQIEGRSMDVKE